MEKGSRFLTAGREWDGKAESHLVDGTGWESTISSRDGGGRDHGTGREQVGKSVRYIVRKSVGNVVGIWPRVKVRNGWEHTRESGLVTTNGVEKRKLYGALYLSIAQTNFRRFFCKEKKQTYLYIFLEFLV